MTTLRSLYVAIVLSFIGMAQAQQPSGTPQCTPSCPAQDEAGFPLGSHSNSNGVLFCSYPSTEGADPNNSYCLYDSSSGALTASHDRSPHSSWCPPTAATTCVNSRRFKSEDNYTALLRKKREEAAMMPRSSELRQSRSGPFKLKARKASASRRFETAE
ncbi:hypothetical protein MSAN_01890900 [Mycena sanguinolenta]|uniref:Uncharacterized protein n=1 Tax=Mycena sanguinolenta TaxID=230812 RepID=A0A8H7CR36_9AGAR|nr:hypothetical protein MSAN_01890900 [Mycena sanguinolenta]